MSEFIRLSVLVSFIVTCALTSGCASLSSAARDGDMNQVKVFLEKGANVNEDDGRPIHFAAARGHTEIVGLLLDRGANIDSTQQIISEATRQKMFSGGMMLKGYQVNIITATPLMAALYNGHFETARYLVGRGASVEKAILMTDQEMMRNSNSDIKSILPTLQEMKSSPSGKRTAGSQENVIHMVDGSEIRGEIMTQNRTSITVKTKYATMTIEKKNIKEIKYK